MQKLELLCRGKSFSDIMALSDLFIFLSCLIEIKINH